MSLPTRSTGGGEVAGRTLRPPPLQWVPLALLALAAELSLIYGFSRLDRGGQWMPVLLPAAHLLLIPFLIKNFSLWGVRLLAIGLVLNVAAMLMNGGLMPVGADAIEAVGRHDPASLQSGKYIPGTKNVYLADGDARASFLGDKIILPLGQPLSRAISVGDVFVMLGVATASIELLITSRRGTGPPLAIG